MYKPLLSKYPACRTEHRKLVCAFRFKTCRNTSSVQQDSTDCTAVKCPSLRVWAYDKPSVRSRIKNSLTLIDPWLILLHTQPNIISTI